MADEYPNLCQTGVLVGQLVYYALSAEDCVELHLTSDSAGFRARSVYMPTHEYDGMLYRVGEFVLVEHNKNFGVLKVSDLIVVRGLQGLMYCVKGEVYKIKPDELYKYSYNPVVVPTSDKIIVQTKMILRKIMLYPQPNRLEDPKEYIVIDHLRPECAIPLKSKDVIVPFYPEKGNMVFITSSSGQDPWIGCILDVHKKNKTCQVHFYVESTKHSGLWQREHIGHRARETVHWDSILGLAQGVWCGRQWRQQQS